MQFWIDVGGTFTDCFAAGDGGALLRRKILSSGRIKGKPASDSDAICIRDPRRNEQRNDLWRGYEVRLLDSSGVVLGASTVAESRPGELRLSTSLLCDPTTAHTYELASGEEAPIVAVRLILGLGLDEPIPPVTVKLGTTRGTNALLTRTGARTAFVTTRGFRDILLIGNQERDHLFELDVRKPKPLFAEAVEVAERIGTDGDVIEQLDEAAALDELRRLRRDGVESIAICLMNSCANSAHETRLGELAAALDFANVSLSHETSALIKLVSRGDTTTVDAYLNPVLADYISRVAKALGPDSDLRLLTSAGGLSAAAEFRGKDCVLSGPAGGVVGFSRVATAAGFSRSLGFDMGGTSTDVARFDGQFERQYETRKAGVRIVAPMMAIETVAAGGGSICQFDGVKLVVGPSSAGADPGPACYGNGGPLTVTDVNLFLGRLPVDLFPFHLDMDAVTNRLSEIRRRVEEQTGDDWSMESLAAGFWRVANANMARAIRSISVARGYDPTDHLLVPFGGAAGQHACSIARDLRIEQVLSHPHAGVLSALGVGLADIVRHATQGVYRPWRDFTSRGIDDILGQVECEARALASCDGADPARTEVRRSIDLRYRGMDTPLTIDEPDNGDFAAAFDAEHQRRFGYLHPDRDLEWVAARAEAIGRSASSLPESHRVGGAAATPDRATRAFFDGQFRDAAIYRRDTLQPGDRLDGPCIVVEDVSTTVVDPGWRGEVLSSGELLLADTAASEGAKASLTATADPVSLEIYNNLFAAIAEQMGATLQNTSSSVNVKERLDFSCALFTAAGDLVVNAPHMPVHLGAMSETVKSVLADFPDLAAGDVVITNDPYRGGSHLPDITVVTPVFADAGDLIFFTASRAHHAEIGGSSPGSMPPMSSNLGEEGVLIRPFKVIDRGVSKLAELQRLLTDSPLPSRSPDDNLADVRAQIAANQQGARDLNALVEQRGRDVVLSYMQHIQAAAEQKMRRALAQLPDGERTFVDHLDNGAQITARITIVADNATIDFTDTSPTLTSNLNANRAIVTAAVMYCMRCLIGENIPLNQGVLAPLTIVLPECLLNPTADDDPALCPAVVGGNVETSQRVVDVLLGALQLAAASQGTMNNLLFGNESFGYYETICGGSGATPAGPGADAIHTHMTNTRITDPEVLEHRFPVRVREFSIRAGSGGTGRHPGGDGAVRRLEFLQPLTVTMLSQRRGDYAPFGLAGGGEGELGANTLLRADGRTEQLSGCCQVEVDVGDQLQIETPGGGGWGRPS